MNTFRAFAPSTGYRVHVTNLFNCFLFLSAHPGMCSLSEFIAKGQFTLRLLVEFGRSMDDLESSCKLVEDALLSHMILFRFDLFLRHDECNLG